MFYGVWTILPYDKVTKWNTIYLKMPKCILKITSSWSFYCDGDCCSTVQCITEIEELIVGGKKWKIAERDSFRACSDNKKKWINPWKYSFTSLFMTCICWHSLLEQNYGISLWYWVVQTESLHLIPPPIKKPHAGLSIGGGRSISSRLRGHWVRGRSLYCNCAVPWAV